MWVSLRNRPWTWPQGPRVWWFFLLSCFVFSVWIQIHPGEDPSGLRGGVGGLHQASVLSDVVFAPTWSLRQTWPGLAGPGWASQACQTSPELLIGCLLLSAGRNSIGDRLAVWLQPELRRTVRAEFVFLSRLSWKGISGEASIVLRISSFETFGSIVPNTVTRDRFESLLLSADSFTHRRTTHSLHMHLSLYLYLILLIQEWWCGCSVHLHTWTVSSHPKNEL